MVRTDQQRANTVKWTEALRSGKYKQIRKRLATNEGMCCLGVAIDVGGNLWIKSTHDWLFDGHATMPPTQYMKHQYGMNTSDSNSLASCNDTLSWNFLSIADVIEVWNSGISMLDAAETVRNKRATNATTR